MSSAPTERATLVLLTPVALDAASWGDSIPKGLPLEQFRFEYPGHGARMATRDGWSLDELADEVATRTTGSLHVVGVSMGSMVGQHLALRHPRRVASAVFAAAGAETDPTRMRERAERILNLGAPGVVDETLFRWFSPAFLVEPAAEALRRTRELLERADARSVATAWEAMASHSVTTELRALAIPVTCIAGASDEATPVTAVTQLAEAILDARLEVLDGPHMLHLETPEVFAAALSSHLERAGVI